MKTHLTVALSMITGIAIGAVAVALIEQDAHQCLCTRQQHAPGLPDVSIHHGIVVEIAGRVGGLCHGRPPAGSGRRKCRPKPLEELF